MVDPTPRQIYTGRYELVRQIARGGMAEVYLAHDIKLDRAVALKILFPELSVDATFVERFRREAQAAANLSHPNIVSIFDWGEEGGTYFIVMEYVEGQPLSALIHREGPLALDRAAGIGVDVAAALGFAHRNGVIHRDVKPGNVLMTREGGVKVTDFGIARAANSTENLTQTGAVMGTATYFSPEQAQGLTVDPRSDIYSLGVVLYEMVTGRPPFVGDGPMVVAYKHVNEPVPDPRQINPSVTPSVQAIIMKCLAKDPGRRYSSADELRADLLRFRQGRPVSAPLPFAGTAMPSRGSGIRATTTVLPPPGGGYYDPSGLAETADDGPDGSNTWVYGVVLVVLLIALGVVLFFLARSLGVIGSGTNSAAPPVTTTIPATTVAPAPTSVTVPNVVGFKYPDPAGTQLQAAGFKVGTPKLAPSDTFGYGTVIASDPPAGTAAQPGDTVTLTVSQGKAAVTTPTTLTSPTVPDVTGQTQDTAAQALSQQGFRSRVAFEPSSTQAMGNVTRTDPPAASSAAAGSTVTLFVSTGPATTSIPAVAQLSQHAATAVLAATGFTTNVVPVQVQRATQVGIVESQAPQPDTSAPPGSTVTIRVGKRAAQQSQQS